MKTLMTLTTGLILAGSVLSGCSGASGDGADSVVSQASDTVLQMLSPAEADSLAYCVGYLNGSDAGESKRRLIEGSPESDYDNGSYMKGFRTALSSQNAGPGYSQGVQAAREIIFKIEELRSYGVEINRDVLLRAIEGEFLTDSVTADRMQQLNSAYNVLLQRVYSSAGN